MRLLLDTRIMLWYALGNDNLSSKARSLIFGSGNDIYCSIVSAWEVAIKYNINPSRIPISDEKFLEYVHMLGGGLLALSEKHIVALKTLRLAPDAKEHRDPFDRMLICQAKAEGMKLLTHDALLQGYGEPCVFLV